MTVFVATPTTRAFEVEYVQSLVYMYKPEGMVYDVVINRPYDVARNVLAQRFLASPNTTHILFADNDATWAPEALVRLLSRGVDIVTGCIYKRALPPVPTFGPREGVNERGQQLYNFGLAARKIAARAQGVIDPDKTPNAVVLSERADDLWAVDGCGLHFCLVARQVIETLSEMHEGVIFRGQPGGQGAGEDFDFCRKAQAAGFTIWADLSVHTGHLAGPGFEVGLRELLAFWRRTDWLDSVKEKGELWEA